MNADDRRAYVMAAGLGTTGILHWLAVRIARSPR